MLAALPGLVILALFCALAPVCFVVMLAYLLVRPAGPDGWEVVV